MSLPDPNDLASLDRDVARAFAAWTKWRARLAIDPAGADDDAPLDRFRHVAGQSAYEAVREDPKAVDAPVRAGLRRWIYALLQARLAQPLEVELAKEALEASARVAIPKPHLVSWREAWAGLLRGVTPTERASWLEAAAERGPALASIAHRREERRVEVENRMGFTGRDPLFDAPSSALAGAAQALLDQTQDLTRDLLVRERRRAELPTDPPQAADAIAISIARDAPEGWPARLAWPWLDEIFGQFARGLRFNPPPLPDAVGASSFARACAAFGGALRVAGGSPSLPFSLAREPEFTAAHRFACVFGALPASPGFQRRVLGNVARVAEGQARVLARTALLSARFEAGRFLLARDPRRDHFEEITSRLFGAPLPAALAGAWPSRRDDGRARLVGLLTAAPLAKELVDRFDDDWFANPRAVQHLRALASGPAREETPPEADPDHDHLTTAARALAHTFEESLS